MIDVITRDGRCDYRGKSTISPINSMQIFSVSVQNSGTFHDLTGRLPLPLVKKRDPPKPGYSNREICGPTTEHLH